MAGKNWDLDGDTITVFIPMIWKRRGGRKVIIAPDGGDAWANTPRPDESLIRGLARAHRWKRLLDAGRYRSAGELAEAEGLTRSFVNRLLRLTLPAPGIQQAILDGRQPKEMQLEELTGTMPSEWEKQRELLTIAGKRACPPEDCGGPWGYQDLLQVLADPAHPDHAERKEWLGDDSSPDHFDPVAANAILAVRFERI
jgi:hypothetical protein